MMTGERVTTMHRARLIVIVAAACGLAVGCGSSDVEESSVVSDESVADTSTAKAAESPKTQPEFDGTFSKPGSPFRVSYKIIGTPVVGSPVTVNLIVTSALGPNPVKVSYRINDASAMTFHEAQPAEVQVAPAENEGGKIPQQVTVIPQREGRLYLNVATAVDTDDGSMSSVIAIPIQVGASTPREIEEHGEVQLDEDGEAVRILIPD